jgi:REP element-mobilizing transposase RayT
MIVGYHLIMTAYGFWLPNDPRGSWSEFVGAWDLFETGGRSTRDKVTERRSYAGDSHDRRNRLATKDALLYPPVRFNGLQARAVARGFGTFVNKSGLKMWACAVMPDHVHMAVARHRYEIEQVAVKLKQAATLQLNEEGLHPLGQYVKANGRHPPCFARGEWKGFLDPDNLAPCIKYVENNPVKAGLKSQVGLWDFVTPVEMTDWL